MCRFFVLSLTRVGDYCRSCGVEGVWSTKDDRKDKLQHVPR